MIPLDIGGSELTNYYHMGVILEIFSDNIFRWTCIMNYGHNHYIIGKRSCIQGEGVSSISQYCFSFFQSHCM